MKFLFIYPPADPTVAGSHIRLSSEFLGFRQESPPMGILYIASVLEEQGHDVEIIDFGVERLTENRIVEKIKSADSVGISIIAYSMKNASIIANIIKQHDRDIPLMVGGPLCTIQPEQTMIDAKADICVKGEAEEIICKIADAIEGKIPLDKIPGVYYKKDGKIKSGPPPKLIKDLDKIPFPARHLVDKYDYGFVLGEKFYKGRVTAILTSRGCPFSCIYCCVPRIGKELGKAYRERSVENVVKELDEISTKYRVLRIVDSNFCVNKERTKKIMDAIAENYDFDNIIIPGLRVDAVDKELLIKMKKAGVKSVSFGIESGNQDVIDFYNKGITLSQAERTVKLARKIGFDINCNFIIGAPIETEEHLKNTYRMMTKLPIDFPLISTLIYFKGSKLWDDAFNQGKISEEEYVVDADVSRGLSNFSIEELKEWSRDMYKRFALRPRYIISQFFRQPMLYKNTYFLKAAPKWLFGLLLKN